MRLFVAINIPASIQEYLHEVQKKLPQAKMRKTSDFHLTLKFLGSVSPKKADEVKEVLSKVVAGAHLSVQPPVRQAGAPVQQAGALVRQADAFLHWQFSLDNKVSFFSDQRGFIKVIWIGVQIPQVIFELQKKIEKDFLPLGFEIENRFKPHLTLARVKFYENHSFEQKLKDIKIDPKEFKVEGFSLIESFLSPTGAKYREVEKYERDRKAS